MKYNSSSISRVNKNSIVVYNRFPPRTQREKIIIELDFLIWKMANVLYKSFKIMQECNAFIVKIKNTKPLFMDKETTLNFKLLCKYCNSSQTSKDFSDLEGYNSLSEDELIEVKKNLKEYIKRLEQNLNTNILKLKDLQSFLKICMASYDYPLVDLYALEDELDSIVKNFN